MCRRDAPACSSTGGNSIPCSGAPGSGPAPARFGRCLGGRGASRHSRRRGDRDLQFQPAGRQCRSPTRGGAGARPGLVPSTAARSGCRVTSSRLAKDPAPCGHRRALVRHRHGRRPARRLFRPVQRRDLAVAERAAAATAGPFAALWGNGWFMLPNPVYGSGLRGGSTTFSRRTRAGPTRRTPN